MGDQNEQYDLTATGTNTTFVMAQAQLAEAMQPSDTLDLVESLPSSISLDGHGMKKPRPKWMFPTITLVCTITVIAALIIGWYSIDARKKLDAARSDCTTSMKLAVDAKTDWTDLLSQDTTVNAAKITDKQVADTAVISQLKTAMSGSTITDAIDCSDSTDAHSLQQMAEHNRGIADAYKEQTTTLSAMVKTVVDSQRKKTLLDAQTLLNSKLDEARKLLATSDGNVQDNAARSMLSDAINTVDKHKTSTNIDELNELTNTLTAAMQTVNDSITAKQQADEAARQQAEAEQAVTPEPTQSSSDNGYQSYTPSYGGQGSNAYASPNNGNDNGTSSSPNSGSSGSYATDNNAGQHQFWQDLNSGKTCSFDSTTGDNDFNDNPMTCQ